MTRRRFTERQTLECAIRQGAYIPCYRCGFPLTVETVKQAEREHPHEYALDGPDTVEACAYSHGECHSKITNGTKATTAGSSKQRLATVKRIRGETCTRKGPPMRSAGFRKPPPGYKHKFGSRPMRPFQPREDVRE